MGLHVFPIPIPPPTSPTTIFCCDTCSLNRRRHGFLSCVCTLTHFIIGGWLLYGSVVPSALCACWSCARPHRLKPTRLLQPWDSPGKSAAVGYHLLLQGIFPTQRSNPGLLHCTQILYQLSHMGSPVSAIHQCKSVIITYVYIYTYTYLHPHSTLCVVTVRQAGLLFLCSSSSLLLSIYFTHDSIYVSILFSQFVSLSPSPTVSTSPFSMPMSSFILCK